jgi:hypothetical protein
MLLRPATCNCGRNIDPLFRIAAAKLHDTKFRALPHSGSGNGPLPLLRVQLWPLPPLFITLHGTLLAAAACMMRCSFRNCSRNEIIIKQDGCDFALLAGCQMCQMLLKGIMHHHLHYFHRFPRVYITPKPNYQSAQNRYLSQITL